MCRDKGYRRVADGTRHADTMMIDSGKSGLTCRPARPYRYRVCADAAFRSCPLRAVTTARLSTFAGA
jgi:hypothetical protein